MPCEMHRWGHRFKGWGCRFTLPRQLILNVLSSTTEHLSAEDVYLTIHKTYPGIGLATVYRTLELLVQMRIVHKFDFGDGRARYELADGSSKPHHHHIICTGCGKVIDYSDLPEEEVQLVQKVEAALEQRHNFKIVNHQLNFYGFCQNCRSQKD